MTVIYEHDDDEREQRWGRRIRRATRRRREHTFVGSSHPHLQHHITTISALRAAQERANEQEIMLRVAQEQANRYEAMMRAATKIERILKNAQEVRLRAALEQALQSNVREHLFEEELFPGNNFCSICLDNDTDSLKFYRCMGCGNIFHSSYIDSWILHHGRSSCPLCRHEGLLSNIIQGSHLN